jgi:hypothetical protein
VTRGSVCIIQEYADGGQPGLLVQAAQVGLWATRSLYLKAPSYEYFTLLKRPWLGLFGYINTTATSIRGLASLRDRGSVLLAPGVRGSLGLGSGNAGRFPHTVPTSNTPLYMRVFVYEHSYHIPIAT